MNTSTSRRRLASYRSWAQWSGIGSPGGNPLPVQLAWTVVFAAIVALGFAVLGFPANDFAGQEPGSDDEIATFCETKFAVDFPMFSKVSVVGEAKHPLYAALTAAEPKAANSDGFRTKLAGYGKTPNPEPEVLWNFEKFLIGRDGAVVGRFSPDMAPQDDVLVSAIERELFASE